MSIIDRTILLNPVEPAPVSMKLRRGLDNKIRFTYLRQNGTPFNTDIGGQLYLVGRTTGKPMRYLITGTDVVNGRGLAYIPAGDITDPNGYNLQVLGIVDTEPSLIARGSASVIETEGFQEIPLDLIDTINLVFHYNEPASLLVNLWKDAAKAAEFDIGSSIISATITASSTNSTVLMPFTIASVDNNTVNITLTVEQVNALPAACWWWLTISNATGVTTLAQGEVTVTGTPEP